MQQATFLASDAHTVCIVVILVVFFITVYGIELGCLILHDAESLHAGGEWDASDTETCITFGSDAVTYVRL